MTTRRSRWVGSGLALAWIAALLTTVFALHTLGHGALATPPVRSLAQFRAWLEKRDTATAAFAMLRVGALAVACYLLAVTVLGFAARVVQNPGLLSLTDAITLPSLRKLIATIAGLSLSASTASLVAMPLLPYLDAQPAVSAPTTSDVHKDSRDAPSAGEQNATRPAAEDHTGIMKRIGRPHDDGTATMRVIKAPPEPPAARPATTRAVTTWSVKPGESFWSVGERVITESWHRPPTDAELVPYWQALIAHNRSRLVDAANADLIYAGQVFELPTPPRRP